MNKSNAGKSGTMSTLLRCSATSLAIALIFALPSCKKDQTTTGSNPEHLKKMSATYGYADYPKNNNGMLVFRDQKHLDNYLDFLDKAEATLNPEDDTRDMHTVLGEIERAQGFNSLRATTHAAYEAQNAKGWPTKEIPDEHFISSPEIRSVLNNQLDVQIGIEVLHYVNKGISVRIDAGNIRLWDQYHKLPQTATLDQVRNIDPLLTGSSIDYIDPNGSLINFGKGSVPKPTGTDFVVKPVVRFPDACNNPKYAQFSSMGLRNAQGYMQGYFIIQYGDGTQEAKTTSLTSAGWRVPDFYHTYPGFGTYTVTIKGYYSQGSAMADMKTQQVTVSPTGCKESYKSSGWQYGTISPTVAWGGKLEMIQIGGSNSNRGRLYAYTKLVKQNADGSWSGFKGNIWTGLNCAVYSTDGNCTNVDHLYGDGYDSNKKDQKVHRTMTSPGNWLHAYSQHTYILNGVNHTIQVDLDVCP